MPSGLLKSEIGIPCRITLCHGWSFWKLEKGINPFQISCFSIRKSVEYCGVVTITIFFFSIDLVIDAITGSLIPFSRKARFSWFRRVKGENWKVVLSCNNTSRFFDLSGWVFAFTGFFVIVVHSVGFLLIILLLLVIVLIRGGEAAAWAKVFGFVIAFAWDSSFRETVSMFETCVARILLAELVITFPFSVYSLNISRRSRILDCSECDCASREARIIKSRAPWIASFEVVGSVIVCRYIEALIEAASSCGSKWNCLRF